MQLGACSCWGLAVGLWCGRDCSALSRTSLVGGLGDRLWMGRAERVPITSPLAAVDARPYRAAGRAPGAGLATTSPASAAMAGSVPAGSRRRRLPTARAISSREYGRTDGTGRHGRPASKCCVRGAHSDEPAVTTPTGARPAAVTVMAMASRSSWANLALVRHVKMTYAAHAAPAASASPEPARSTPPRGCRYPRRSGGGRRSAPPDAHAIRPARRRRDKHGGEYEGADELDGHRHADGSRATNRRRRGRSWRGTAERADHQPVPPGRLRSRERTMTSSTGRGNGEAQVTSRNPTSGTSVAASADRTGPEERRRQDQSARVPPVKAWARRGHLWRKEGSRPAPTRLSRRAG